MTLANCRRLLKHYEESGQKERAEEMRQHLEKKLAKVKEYMNNPQSPHSRYKESSEFKEEKPKPKPKEDAKKS